MGHELVWTGFATAAASLRDAVSAFHGLFPSSFCLVVSRADSDRNSSSLNLGGKPLHVPPREDTSFGHPPPQQQSNVPPTRRNQGPLARSQGNRNPLDEPIAMKQVIELLRNLGLDDSVMETIQDHIQAKTKADKYHSEIVDELERKRGPRPSSLRSLTRA